MPKVGYEIDMLALGDADSILVTRWQGDESERVLIDGGRKSTTATVRQLLRARGITHIDHVVCSHPHDDHAAGLVDLVADEGMTFGRAWLHIPERHVDLADVRRAVRVAKSLALPEAQLIEKSLAVSQSLLSVLQRRGIKVAEPFASQKIGFLTVCGPTEEYYEELVATFADADQIRAMHQAEETTDDRDLLLERLAKALGSEDDQLLSDPRTSPENNSSTIMMLQVQDEVHLFTADAGVEALWKVIDAGWPLSKCRWMQIPHHGSRRNITRELIEHVEPEIAFVSAEGGTKHPRRAVVKAFKDLGTTVCSTHHPWCGHLNYHIGCVPRRSGLVAADPL